MILGNENWLPLLLADLRLIMPEVWMVLAMCAVLLVPFIRRGNATAPIAVAAVGLLLALFATLGTAAGEGADGGGVFRAVFHGMLAIDPFSQFFKILLIVFTMLILAQWLIVSSRREVSELDVPDFLCLLLGASFGMALMASANNLLMIFVAIESASIPSFALAGFFKKRLTSTESSLKYVLFGAASSGIMLYGMSLIYGSTGTLELSGVAVAAREDFSPLLAMGMLGMMGGFAFKLSAVPLHFWCPDVFEGAPIEVTTFLSVASKGAAICVLVRVLDAFAVSGGMGYFGGIAAGVGILGAVTATWGNLVALHQTNVKRLLAYSSISHAGYMIMACSVILLGDASRVASAILFYLLVYMFMNLGAFTVAALIADRTGSEDIRDYKQLIRRSPALAIVLSLFLLSLFGMPGLGGFMGKIFLMTAMAKAGAGGYVLIAVLLINTLFSLYYYMRPIYFMVFVADDQNRPAMSPRAIAWPLLALCVVMLLWTGFLPGFTGKLTSDYGTLISTPAHRASSEAVVQAVSVDTVEAATHATNVDR